MEVKIEITIKSHGHWDNSLNFTGSYEQAKEQINLFYEKVKLSIDKVTEHEVAYHDGVAKHTK